MGIKKRTNRASKKVQQDLEKRIKDFQVGYKKLTEETEVDLRAEIEFSVNGIMPAIKLADLKAMKEEQARIMAKTEENKKKAEAKQRKAIREMKDENDD